jgi:hypothetical protein
MTPEEAISTAFRAASKEIATGMTSKRAEAYQGFLTAASGYLNDAAKGLTMVANHRPNVSDSQMDALEMHAYHQVLQATITSLMALSHFPYLGNIESSIVREKLC